MFLISLHSADTLTNAPLRPLHRESDFTGIPVPPPFHFLRENNHTVSAAAATAAAAAAAPAQGAHTPINQSFNEDDRRLHAVMNTPDIGSLSSISSENNSPTPVLEILEADGGVSRQLFADDYDGMLVPANSFAFSSSNSNSDEGLADSTDSEMDIAISLKAAECNKSFASNAEA